MLASSGRRSEILLHAADGLIVVIDVTNSQYHLKTLGLSHSVPPFIS